MTSARMRPNFGLATKDLPSMCGLRNASMYSHACLFESSNSTLRIVRAVKLETISCAAKNV